MVNFGPLSAEICWRVCGTAANVNGFRGSFVARHPTDTPVAQRRQQQLARRAAVAGARRWSMSPLSPNRVEIQAGGGVSTYLIRPPSSSSSPDGVICAAATTHVDVMVDSRRPG